MACRKRNGEGKVVFLYQDDTNSWNIIVLESEYGRIHCFAIEGEVEVNISKCGDTLYIRTYSGIYSNNVVSKIVHLQINVHCHFLAQLIVFECKLPFHNWHIICKLFSFGKRNILEQNSILQRNSILFKLYSRFETFIQILEISIQTQWIRRLERVNRLQTPFRRQKLQFPS